MSKANPKTYTEEDIARARLQGRKEAEEYLQERLNAIVTTNSLLLEEIVRLDWKYPVTGVLLPYRYAEKLERKLRKKNMIGYANRMREYIDISNATEMEKEGFEILDKIEHLLDDVGIDG